MTLHLWGDIFALSDETATVTSMNFLTFEDNYLAGQSPERKIIMTNKEKALALIGTFVSGDTAKAKELLAPGYIQHNTSIADGLSGLGAALEAMAKQGISMVYNKTHMVLADGDYALACSEGTFGGVPTTYYDLFRVENGFIAEHWDVMETLADKSTWANENGKF